MIKLSVVFKSAVLSMILSLLIIFPTKGQNKKDKDLMQYYRLKSDSVDIAIDNQARIVLNNQIRYVGHFNLRGRIETSNLVLSDDTLFVSKRDTIICFNGKTGEKYWTKKYKFNKKIINTRSNIILTYYKSLKGIDKKTGELVWINDEYHASPSKYNEQKNLFFLIKDSTIVGLDPCLGKISWILRTPIPVGRLMIYKNLLVSNTSDSLFCINLKSNKKEWKFCKQLYGPSSVLSYKQNLYLKSDEGIEIIDIETGERILKKNIEESRSDFTPLKSGILTRNYNQNKIMYESFRNDKNNWIYKLPCNETLQITPYIFPVMTVYENILYINSKQNILRAINLKNGKLLWEFDTYSYVTSNIVIANGVLYLVNVTGQVIAIDTNLKNGVQKWTNLRDFE